MFSTMRQDGNFPRAVLVCPQEARASSATRAESPFKLLSFRKKLLHDRMPLQQLMSSRQQHAEAQRF